MQSFIHLLAPPAVLVQYDTSSPFTGICWNLSCWHELTRRLLAVAALSLSSYHGRQPPVAVNIVAKNIFNAKIPLSPSFIAKKTDARNLAGRSFPPWATSHRHKIKIPPTMHGIRSIFLLRHFVKGTSFKSNRAIAIGTSPAIAIHPTQQTE